MFNIFKRKRGHAMLTAEEISKLTAEEREQLLQMLSAKSEDGADEGNEEKIDETGQNQQQNQIEGGKADALTVEQIATKHNVSVDVLKEQLEKGLLVETEHTKDKEKALEIAMDHLAERPDYYNQLAKMEEKPIEKPQEEFMKSVNEQMANMAKQFEEFKAMYQTQQETVQKLKEENDNLRRTTPSGVPNQQVKLGDEDPNQKNRANVTQSYFKGTRAAQ